MMRFANGLLLALMAGPALAQEPDDALASCLPTFGAATSEVSACVGVLELGCLAARAATIEEDVQFAHALCLIGERNSWGWQILRLEGELQDAVLVAEHGGRISAARAVNLRDDVAGRGSTDWMNAREAKCYRETEPYNPVAEEGCMLKETVKRYLFLNEVFLQLLVAAPLQPEIVSE